MPDSPSPWEFLNRITLSRHNITREDPLYLFMLLWAYQRSIPRKAKISVDSAQWDGISPPDEEGWQELS
jgi:hypothetical protein